MPGRPRGGPRRKRGRAAAAHRVTAHIARPARSGSLRVGGTGGQPERSSWPAAQVLRLPGRLREVHKFAPWAGTTEPRVQAVRARRDARGRPSRPGGPRHQGRGRPREPCLVWLDHLSSGHRVRTAQRPGPQQRPARLQVRLHPGLAGRRARARLAVDLQCRHGHSLQIRVGRLADGGVSGCGERTRPNTTTALPFGVNPHVPGLCRATCMQVHGTCMALECGHCF